MTCAPHALLVPAVIVEAHRAMASWWASIWPHQPTVALLVWSVVLFVGTVWQAQCGHSAYDRSLSTSDCTVLRGQPDICVTPPALCLSAWTIKACWLCVWLCCLWSCMSVAVVRVGWPLT